MLDTIRFIKIAISILAALDAQIEGLPRDCDVEIDVEKRDSPIVDFVVCVRKGKREMSKECAVKLRRLDLLLNQLLCGF